MQTEKRDRQVKRETAEELLRKYQLLDNTAGDGLRVELTRLHLDCFCQTKMLFFVVLSLFDSL